MTHTPNATQSKLRELATQSEKQAVYNFFSYDSKLQYPAPDNKRLVTCMYRTKEGTKAPRPNEGIFIPNWIKEQTVKDNLTTLMPLIISFLQTQEESMIKEAHRNFSKGFGDSYFNVEHLVEFIEAKDSSSRLSSAAIKEWFLDSGLAEALTALYQEKTEDDIRTAVIVEFISKKLQSLASPKTTWNDEEKEKILPLLEAVKDTAIGVRLIARIEGMKKPESLLDIL